jgi:hypothetical protein
MRKRRTLEELSAEPSPIMYRSNGRYFFNHLGDNVSGSLRSSFSFDPKETGELEYRNGWTRLEKFFADDYLTAGEMVDLVKERFKVEL